MQFQKVASRIGSVLIFLIFGLSLFVFVTVLANWGKGVPNFYGYSFLSVTTPSMEPLYPVGSVVITKKGDTKDLVVGDVISFYSDDPAIYGKPNTHRILEIRTNATNKTYFITKGDNNPIADGYTVDEDKVIGKVQGSVGSLGKVLDKVKNRTVLFFLLIVPLSAVMFFEIRHLQRVLKNKDGSTILDGSTPEEQPAQPDADEPESSGDELLDKINRLQAKIDKLKPPSDESSEKEEHR